MLQQQLRGIAALLTIRVVVDVPSGMLKKGSVPTPRAFPRLPRSLLMISQYCLGCAPGRRPSKQRPERAELGAKPENKEIIGFTRKANSQKSPSDNNIPAEFWKALV